MNHSFILHKIRTCSARHTLFFSLLSLILGICFLKIDWLSLVFCILAAIGIFVALIAFFFPTISLPYRRLSRYGNAAELLEDAENELIAEPILQEENLYLTPKYLISVTPFSIAVIPLVSVLWVFQLNNMRFSLKTKREMMYYHLRIVTITGDTFKIQNRRKEEISSILNILIDRYPNFFYDYSADHEEMVHYILTENKNEIRENKRKSRKKTTEES